jgi:hypothetical protein
MWTLFLLLINNNKPPDAAVAEQGKKKKNLIIATTKTAAIYCCKLLTKSFGCGKSRRHYTARKIKQRIFFWGRRAPERFH